MDSDNNKHDEDSLYRESLDFIFSQLPMFSRVGAAAYKPGLDTSLRLDEYFGHPHRRYRTIHVAGTNGKGSVSHSLASILQAHGYRTGLYTSPHLVDFRERMRVDGEMIPRSEVIDFVRKWRGCGYDGHPSFFELTMMMAFRWFARMEVDVAVIEVGMGGRLDSTNIITPEACVITNISPDHTQFLGATLPEIAREKAGIIKPGIPVTIGEAQGEVRKVFESTAESVGAPIVFAEDSPRLIKAEETENLAGWRCTDADGLEFTVPLAGDYQKRNINTVLTAVGMLRRNGYDINDSGITEGLGNVTSRTGLRGRWTVISDSPLTIADTGHNEAGLGYNIAQLRRLMSRRSGGKLRMVIGFVADKAIDKILGLLPKEALYYVTNADIPRALKADILLRKMTDAGFEARQYPDPKTAARQALEDSAPSDIIYIGGSTFIVADYLK